MGLIEYLLQKQVEYNFTQKQLAEFLDISPPALNYIMTGKRVAGDKITRNIARKFSIPLTEVVKMRDN